MSSRPKRRRPELPADLPDDLRRVDTRPTAPDSLPRPDEPSLMETRPDGGVAQHPIHDEDREDMEPQDYEQEFSEAARSGFEPVSDESQDVEDSGDEFDAEELGPESVPSDDRDKGPGRRGS